MQTCVLKTFIILRVSLLSDMDNKKMMGEWLGKREQMNHQVGVISFLYYSTSFFLFCTLSISSGGVHDSGDDGGER